MLISNILQVHNKNRTNFDNSTWHKYADSYALIMISISDYFFGKDEHLNERKYKVIVTLHNKSVKTFENAVPTSRYLIKTTFKLWNVELHNRNTCFLAINRHCFLDGLSNS